MRRILTTLISVLFVFLTVFTPLALADSVSYVPTVQGSPEPDWTKITFGSLPALDSASTAVLEDVNLQNQMGYNPSRSWLPGTSLMDVVKVGDLYQFGLGSKTVGSFLGGTDPNQVSLGALSALNNVSLSGLVQAIPGLGNIPVSAFPLAQSVLSGQLSSAPAQAVQLASNYFPEINQFLKANPALANLPMGQILQGNWEGALSQGLKTGLGQLTKAVPQLANLPLGNIVSDLSTGNYSGALSAGVRAGGQYLLSEAIKDVPQLSNLPLGTLVDLNKFSLASVPGLTQTAISNIPGISNQSISTIPGLGNVPISQVLDLTQLLKMEFAKVDFLDQAAGKANYTISGSTKDDKFKPEPCVGKCPHFEVQDSISLPGISVKGRQWVTSVQKVPGGKGILGRVAGGKEPTGMVPWGFKPNLKLVASKVTDSTGKIDLALYLRVCHRNALADFGCTPYFIGPIPIGSVGEKGLVLIATSDPPPQFQIPGDIQNQINNILGPDCAGGGSATAATQPDKYGYKAHKEANPTELVQVPTPSGLGRTEVLQKDAAAAFDKMRQDAARQGIDLTVVSGFRSTATQQQLWDAQVAKQGSEAAAAKISAPPGYSEHMTGYAMDISGQGGVDLTQNFQNTATYAWLTANAKNYGFQQSYTKTSTGGAENEPWHWRFEGTAAAQVTFNPPPVNPTATGNQNLTQYLARISVGESSSGANIGPNPETGAYGEYQMTPETRATVLQRTGLDGWSTDKTTRDKAALAWISMYGQEKGVDLISAIKSGNFTLADQVLSKAQFTSLPGGREQSPVWQNASYQQKYGPGGNGGSGSCGVVAAAVPCPPGKTCLLLNPNKAGTIVPRGYFGAPRVGHTHQGIDLQSPKGYQNYPNGPGENILAAADGQVVYTVPVGGPCGGIVFLTHPDRNITTRYLHMVKVFVAQSQSIKRGQVIGVEGAETYSQCHVAGVHLHYEIRVGGGLVDPATIAHEPPIPPYRG